MDNLSHGFAYSPDGRQHVQQESTNQTQDDINQSLLQHGIPYTQLMTGMPLSSENISFTGPNQFGSARFPLGFSQNIAPQGFPHLMPQSQLCQNLELEMSQRQPRPSQTLRHQSHGQSLSGFGLDMSPVTGPAFPSPSESSRRHGVDHLPSFSSIVASAASSISTMDMQRSYSDSHKQQMLSSPHELTTASLRNSLVSDPQPFHNLPPVQSFQHQENTRPSHLSSMDSHRLDMASEQKSLPSRGPYDTYTGVDVHSKHHQSGNTNINGDAPSPPLSPVKQQQTFSEISNSSRNNDSQNSRSMAKHMQNANREHGVHLNMSEKPSLGSSPEADYIQRSVPATPNRSSNNNSSQVRFLNKFTPSAIKKQNTGRGAIKFILAGRLEGEKYSPNLNTDLNWSSVYIQETFSRDTRTIAIQTGVENEITSQTIKQEVDNEWSASDNDDPVEVEDKSLNVYHSRSMVPNPDPAAKSERLEMAYDNPSQLLSPTFNTGVFRMGRNGLGAAENGISQAEDRRELSSEHEVEQNNQAETRYNSATLNNSLAHNENFSEKDIANETIDEEQREAIFQATKEKLDMERMEVNIQIDETQCVLINDQKRWQCRLCAKNYTTKHNLVTHVLDHNGIKPHLCRVCGKYFKQLSHLNTHMLTHDNVKPHVCTICSKGFTQVSHLKRHQAVHLGDNKPYKCDVCGRGFAYPSELRVHKERHVPGRDKCVECGEEFGSPRLLKQHQATHEDREDLNCADCGRGFRYPSQLRDHMMCHSGTRPHICPECGMDFMKEHHLRAHMFTHSGLRPYTCKECGRSFNQKANLQRHQLIHSSERAYKCELCDKTFTQPQTLKAHMVVHADKKPYQCNLCGKEFGRLHNLQGHMHMHTDSKPYACFCGSAFTLKGNLNRHKKVKHGLDESTESMEEEAVNFLSSMERAREDREDDYLDMEDRCDGDPNDSLLDDSLQDDSRFERKQRKSKPRKVLQQSGSDNAAGGGGDGDTAPDSEVKDNIQHNLNSDDHGEEEERGRPTRNAKRNWEAVCSSDNDEEYSGLHVKFRQSTRQVAKLRDFKEEFDSCPSDSEEVVNDDGNDNDWVPVNPRKGRKLSKGAKLDSIIAEKFLKE
ncbi:uncharacterized protein LOC121385791 [Gigantopelta aegis]|uniref:uncharacterized protein LOC121385791 n=1 Tax=Gigantopelta aegis TaxID=1735272 RepID=UPI001B88899B|nr:uncharacterized protein LOC121385791 [Gigantopelta aegis]